MLKITLDAVLLEIKLLISLAHHNAKLVNWKVELSVHRSSLDGEILPYKSNSIELAPDLVYFGHVAGIERIGTPDWLAKSEAFEHVVHELLLSLEGHHARLHKIKIKSILKRVVLILNFAVTYARQGVAKVRSTSLLDASLEIVAVFVFIVMALDYVLLLATSRATGLRVYQELRVVD